MLKAVEAMAFESPKMTWKRYSERLTESGGIVEELIAGRLLGEGQMVPRVLQKVFALVQVFAHRRLDVDEAALPADVALVGRIDDLAHLEPRRRARARPVAVELAEIELDVDPEVDPRLPHDVGDVLELPRRVRAAVDRDDGLAAPLQQAVEAGVVEMATV